MSEERKELTLRIDKNDWRYFKKLAVDREVSFTALISSILSEYRKKHQKKVDRRNGSDTMVS